MQDHLELPLSSFARTLLCSFLLSVAPALAQDCNGNGVDDAEELAQRPAVSATLSQALFVAQAEMVDALLPNPRPVTESGTGVRDGLVLDGSHFRGDGINMLHTYGEIESGWVGVGAQSSYVNVIGNHWFAVAAENVGVDEFSITGQFSDEPGRDSEQAERIVGVRGIPVRVFEQRSFGADLPVVEELWMVPLAPDDLRYGFTPAGDTQTHVLRRFESGGSFLYLVWVRDSTQVLSDAQRDTLIETLLDTTVVGAIDCDGNGMLDECELNPASDRNGNGVLDACEPDCDGDGLPDDYELATGQADDCNENGIPDACEIASGQASDVDLDGRPDRCQPDCNDNQVPDSFEIAGGASDDCNANGIPDDCDPPRSRTVRSSAFTPDQVQPGQWAHLRWSALPSEADVYIQFDAEQARETVLNVRLGDTLVGQVEMVRPGCCDTPSGSLVIARDLFNGLVTDGRADLSFQDANVGVFLFSDELSTLTVTVAGTQTGGSEDCNGDGIPDDCQFADGTVADENGNGRSDACEPDCDDNGLSDLIELADGLVSDCNGNGIPDQCDEGVLYRSEVRNENVLAEDIRQVAFVDVPAPSADGFLRVTGADGSRDLQVVMEGILIDTVAGPPDCAFDERSLLLAPEALQAAAEDRVISFTITAAPTGNDCPQAGFTLQLVYPTGTSSDCDFNGRLDECELDAGTDCDGSGVLDVCENTGLQRDLRLVRERFDATALPMIRGFGLYEFAGGETGDRLFDDGAGTIRDHDNRISTDRADAVPYTGGVVLPADDLFGPGSTYMTRKRPGLFALMASGASVALLRSSGSLQDHDAILDSARLFTSVHGVDYTILTKRFTQLPYPAPHHIYVVPGTWTTVDDSAFVLASSGGGSSTIYGEQLPGIRELIYLYAMTASGAPLSDAEVTDLVNVFLENVMEADRDCDDDGVVDSCQIGMDPTLDLNANGVLDGCEPDCNSNQIADTIEIADGAVADCDQNGVPDSCQFDCDANGIPDRCQVLAGEQDCDQDQVLDRCQPDCDGDGLPDTCALRAGEVDCDGNGVPDDCDLATGAASDCNANGVPDTCDLPQSRFILRLEPIVANEPYELRVRNLPVATAPVTYRVRGRVDGSRPARFFRLEINNWDAITFFGGQGPECDGIDTDAVEMSAEQYNEIVTHGQADITLTPNGPQNCPDGWIELVFDYGQQTTSEDCNQNMVPDECDPDFNNNGIVDDCGECLGDTNGNGRIGERDLLDLLQNFGTASQATVEMGDADGDGDVDLIDLAYVLSVYGQRCDD